MNNNFLNMAKRIIMLMIGIALEPDARIRSELR